MSQRNKSSRLVDSYIQKYNWRYILALDQRLRCKVERLIYKQLDLVQTKHSYLIDQEWIVKWQQYIKGGNNPGRILTWNISNGSGKLIHGLKYRTHYRVLNKKQWKFLSTLHGNEAPVRIESSQLKQRRKKKNRVNAKSVDVSQSSANPPQKLLMNPNFTYNNIQGDDQGDLDASSQTEDYSYQSTNIPSYGLRGLANKGSTCYINVGLQCILTLETIRNYYIIGDYNIHAKNNSKPICDAFRHAALEIYAGNKTVGVPQPLWDATANKFDLLRQQDLIEWVRWIFDEMEEELGYTNFIKALFQGTYISTLKCVNCNNESKIEQGFQDIVLQVRQELKQSFKDYCQIEVVSFQCNNCNKDTFAEKSISFKKLPLCLIIQLTRFQYFPRPRKIGSHVQFPMNLDLRPFSQDPGRYALVAIGEHKGNIEGGHYVAYCKRGKNWCKFDDDRVRRIHRADVASTQAYMLVYSRK